jgi:hypothetical protein
MRARRTCSLLLSASMVALTGCTTHHGGAQGTTQTPTTTVADGTALPWTRVTVGEDGRQLTIHALGDPACTSTIDADVVETSSAVRIALIDKSPQTSCDLLGEDITVSAQLKAGMGRRRVRDGGCERLFGAGDGRCRRDENVRALAANTCPLSDVTFSLQATSVSNEAIRAEITASVGRGPCHLHAAYRLVTVNGDVETDLGRHVLDADIGSTVGTLATFMLHPVCQFAGPWQLRMDVSGGTSTGVERTIDGTASPCRSDEKPRVVSDDLLP